MPSPFNQQQLNFFYQQESRRVLATLIRLLGDFDLAEDALQEAFTAAWQQWPESGIPANPYAWLVSTGRFKAIDLLRKHSRLQARETAWLEQQDWLSDEEDFTEPNGFIEDDRLRLIFTCCHPALSAEARVALTLREVCGLTTEAIARSFLVTPPTLAQRIVRARQKIRTAGIPYEVPDQTIFAERLHTVLQVIYLVFNEGYSSLTPAATIEQDRPDTTLPDLASEAIRLTRLLLELHPDDEINGLLALMLLQESRRMTRTCANGNLILLEDQDRSLWNADLIVEGVARVQQAWATGNPGFYSLQAAIAALHAEAASAVDTDWHEISGIYTLLLNRHPSPVVALNRAIAITMHQGPQAGIDLITPLIESDLSNYHYAYAARAKLQQESGNIDAARSDYTRALELSDREAEKAFLQKQLNALQ